MSPVTRADLLPVNATEFEKALSATAGRVEDIPVQVDRLLRWDECPEEFLPWLAWAVSVDLWDDAWSTERKREVIRDSYELHRLKGTLAGIRKTLSYVDAEVVRARVAPQEFFWAPDDLVDQDAWKATLPRLEIATHSNPGTADGFYCDFDYYDDDGAQSYSYYLDEDAGKDYARKATLYKDGETFDVSWIDGAGPFTPAGVERFSLPGYASEDSAYYDQFFYDDAFWSVPDQDFETISIRRSGIEGVVAAGYEVTDIRPELKPLFSEAAVDELYFSGEAFWDETYYPDNDAHLGFAEVFYLYLNESDSAAADPYGYYNVNMPYGIEDFTAELLLKIPEYSAPWESYDDLVGVYVEPDYSRFDQVLSAVTISKSARDTIYADNEVLRPRKFSDRRKFGDGLKFGDYVRAI